MKITVVTVSFNARDCIEKTIKSVLSQTWEDLEYIVIDGGSRDGTASIIEKYSHRLAGWRSEPDGGIYFGMNKGIAAATGEYTLFLNADDSFVDEDVVKKIALFLDGREADVAYGDFYYEYEYGRYLRHPKAIEQMGCSMAVCHQATLVKTSLLKQRPFDTQYRLSADFDMLSDLYLKGYKFLYMPFPVANMVMGSGSTHENEARSVEEFQKIMASHGQTLTQSQKGLLKRKKLVDWVKRNLPACLRRPLFRFIAKIYKPL